MALELTEAQWRMLARVSQGFAWDDLPRPTERARAKATRQALTSRGLLDQRGHLTAAGRQALVDRACALATRRAS